MPFLKNTEEMLFLHIKLVTRWEWCTVHVYIDRKNIVRQSHSYKHWAEASVKTKGKQKSFSYVEVSLLAHVLKGAQLLTD